MITRNFKLFLNAGKQIPLMINVSQYDHGEKWVFTLYDDHGQKYTPSTGAIVGIKADNKGIINTGTVNSAGQVEIMETQQMTAAAGKAVFELVIDDGTHGTANFVVLVEPKPGNNADLSETDISMIEQAIEAASTIKPYGSPLVASTVAGMTDHDKVYVYVGSETGYTSGNWYYWDGSAWTSGGVYNSVAVQTDTTLTLSGVAADAKKTGDEISDLKSQIQQMGGGIPTAVREAMATLFNSALYKVTGLTDEKAVINSWASTVTAITLNQSAISISGEGTYQLVATTTPSGGAVSWTSSNTAVATVSNNGLVTSVGNGTATITASSGDVSATCTATITGFATLTSISAVYTQGGTVYTTDSLDSLKANLVVTAHYDDTSTATLADDDYTLSGNLTVGTSTIVVSYGDKTATFDVIVTQAEQWDFEWDYTDGLPNDNGMVLTNTGSNTINLASNGLSIATQDSSSSLVAYEYQSISNVKTEVISELVFEITAFSTQSGSGVRDNAALGGTGATAKKCAQLNLSQNGVQYLGTASGWSTLSATPLSLNTEYTVRIDQTDGNADIYLNGTLVGSLENDFREAVGYAKFGVYRGVSALIKSYKLKITA